MNKTKNRKARVIVGAFLVGASCLMGSPIAFAGGSPPTEVTFSFDIPADFIKDGACDFPVRWSGNQKAGTIVLPGNRFIFTSPRAEVVVTNLDDPTKSVTLKVPGAFHVSTDQDGNIVTVVTGRNLLGDPVAGMVLALGTFSFIFDSGGTLVRPLTGNGQLIDVCELID